MDAASPRAGQRHLQPLGPQRIAFVSDAWLPQINGVVRVLQTLHEKLAARGHRVEVFAPDRFKAIPCPTYPEIPLSVLPGRALAGMLERFRPDAIHIAEFVVRSFDDSLQGFKP